MKLNDKGGSFKHYEGKEQIQMGLDLDNTHSIMSLLRNNIYADPLKSWVREIYSNAVDAHARVGYVNEPIEVELRQGDHNGEFIVRDYGNSMDRDTIANVYAKMGKSDKRSGNNEMGGWGLGAKSPLAYTDHFWIETWTVEDGNNIYRKWVQYIDSSRVGALTLLEEDTWMAGKTGTKVTIPYTKKDHRAVCDALQYYLSYTKASYTLLGDTEDCLEIGRKWYTHYGNGWAVDFDCQNQGYWLSELNDGLAIVGDIPYEIDCKTLFNNFHNNLNSLVHIIEKKRPKYIKDSQRNIEMFCGFLASLSYHRFEIVLPIGSVDLSASREDLQYTDRTCGFMFGAFYDMFLELYKFFRMELVLHPNYAEACIIYNNYSGGFKKYFLSTLRWAKEDIAFDTNPSIFRNTTSHDYHSYQLDTIYVNGGYTDKKDVLRRDYTTRLYTGTFKYEICIQDTDYKNVSKFVKYHAQKKEHYKYKTVYLCIDPKDLDKVYEWIKETTTTVKVSDLVKEFRANAPATSSNRAAAGKFKALTYKGDLVRPKAYGMGRIFEYEQIDIESDDTRYYILESEWDNLPIEFTRLRNGYKTSMNGCLKNYLDNKEIEYSSLVYTKKLTKNFKNNSWVNFIDLLKEDYELYKKHHKELVINLFRVAYVNRQQSIFTSFWHGADSIINADSMYLHLQNKYNKANEYLQENMDVLLYLSFIDTKVGELNYQRLGSCYMDYYDGNVYGFGSLEPAITEIILEHDNYLRYLPFLKTYRDYRVASFDLTNQNYTEYINLIEEKYKLYYKEEVEEPIVIPPHLSEFARLLKRHQEREGFLHPEDL